jgi:NAD-dependent SIR2 family protein deacetylase
MTEAAEDRCWNCGTVPDRWFEVAYLEADKERLVCSNCFAATIRPRVYYGWASSPSRDWDDAEEELDSSA